jgi:hypothetical protein
VPEDQPTTPEPPRKRRARVEILNALMFRCTERGTQFVWPHSSLITAYRKRGFVLLVDAATISPEDARSAEIQAVREQEEDMWRRRSFEQWAKAWKPKEGL